MPPTRCGWRRGWGRGEGAHARADFRASDFKGLVADVQGFLTSGGLRRPSPRRGPGSHPPRRADRGAGVDHPDRLACSLHRHAVLIACPGGGTPLPGRSYGSAEPSVRRVLQQATPGGGEAWDSRFAPVVTAARTGSFGAAGGDNLRRERAPDGALRHEPHAVRRRRPTVIRRPSRMLRPRSRMFAAPAISSRDWTV